MVVRKATPNGSSGAKANGKILDFFKKAAPPTPDDSDDLFIRDESPSKAPRGAVRGEPSRSSMTTDFVRFNEISAPVKRQRTDISGPSQTLDENEDSQAWRSDGEPLPKPELTSDFSTPNLEKDHLLRRNSTRESLSKNGDRESLLGDLADELGDEERKWLEEQMAMEREFEEDEFPDDEAVHESSIAPALSKECEENTLSECPICNSSLRGISANDASVHINGCLDGNPVPPPQLPEVLIKTESRSPSRPPEESEPLQRSEDPADPPGQFAPPKRFLKAAIPRPGQENPFSLGASSTSGSAFSKIMSSHTEDTAWQTAASNQLAERGMPAYRRTCPFYKIMPGFSITVDAFRYGAVEGCNAYFLSHYHSDHYTGLTSSWCHGPIYCSRITANLVKQQLKVNPKFVKEIEWDEVTEIPDTGGATVIMMPANHCPGSSIFLFEKRTSYNKNGKTQRILHCGDFRACPAHVQHPLLRPRIKDAITGKERDQKIDICYLDTTYLTPKYAFPRQDEVVEACAEMCLSLSKEVVDENDSWEQTKKARAGQGMVQFVQRKLSEGLQQEVGADDEEKPRKRGRLLVVVGTYSIGKERICLGVARALDCKIFAAPGKMRICHALEDPELNARLTDDPLEAQIHMQMLMEIRPETLADYLTSFKPHFSRIIGFRPTGWNYRPPGSRMVDSPAVQTVLHGENWRPRYSMAELMPQRGSTRESSCYGVPYSEHSSFRELTMFACALHIERIIPTVNVGSAKSRERMKSWIEKWAMERKKNGLYEVEEGAEVW